MVQILLAEEQNIVRNGIRMLLETDQSINIVGEANNAYEVIEFVKQGNKMDVVLADLQIPNLDGISMIRELKELCAELHIVILTSLDDEKFVARAFAEGADAYLLKSVKADELIFSIKHVNAGGKYICSEQALKMLNRQLYAGINNSVMKPGNIELSEKEIQVLQSIAEGLTNTQISDKLLISKRTIEGYRHTLIEKTGSLNTASLVRFAMKNGLII
jgi:DNA-binding NarL/FixJ family response regulator